MEGLIIPPTENSTMAKKKKARPTKRHARTTTRKAPARKKRQALKKVAATATGAAGAGGGREVKDAVALLRWTHDFLNKLTADFPPEKMTAQACPTDNHVMWTLGHLATTYVWIASLLDGKVMPLPESYQTLFGYKSKPTSDAGAYPPAAEVRRNCDAAFARLLEAAGALKEADAHKPVLGESYGFASDRLDAIYKTIWHEGWHQGQISCMRRALGMPSVM